MNSKSQLKLKVCCISSLNEAKLAIEAGAHILGLVGHMPSGPGVITDELAAQIVANTSKHIETFLLSSETTAEGIIKHHHRVKSTAIQMVDELPTGSHAEIKASLPEIKLVQVIHVLNESSVEYARQVANDVDAILLDSGNPDLLVKELGGTGRTHNWELSRKIVDSIKIPVYLAGGLNASNVGAAISKVKPHGIDLCSGVRIDGHLDQLKLIEFIAKVNQSS